MLYDRHGRAVEFGSEFERGIGIVQVVVAQLLALDLGRGRHTGPAVARGIERSVLMGVFAVTHCLDTGARQ